MGGHFDYVTSLMADVILYESHDYYGQTSLPVRRAHDTYTWSRH